jgi:hypothetical protein
MLTALRAALIAASVLAPAAARADYPAPPIGPQSTVAYDGSLYVVDVLPDHVEIRLSQPRPGLAVPPGAVLVTGHWNAAGFFEGTAYRYAGHCGAVPYPVGGYVGVGGMLVVSGYRPSVDMTNCARLEVRIPITRMLFQPVWNYAAPIDEPEDLSQGK